MKVELTKKDLISLVKGSSPNYNVMSDPRVTQCGHYVGGFNDRWVWGEIDEDLTEQQLWDLYVLCRDSWK